MIFNFTFICFSHEHLKSLFFFFALETLLQQDNVNLMDPKYITHASKSRTNTSCLTVVLTEAEVGLHMHLSGTRILGLESKKSCSIAHGLQSPCKSSFPSKFNNVGVL